MLAMSKTPALHILLLPNKTVGKSDLDMVSRGKTRQDIVNKFTRNYGQKSLFHSVHVEFG